MSSSTEGEGNPTAKQWPNLRPWQPGQSGNPKGRPKNLGATVLEHLNGLGAAGLTKQQLEAIRDDETEGFVKRAAAVRAIRLIEAPDIADYSDLITGRKTLKQLRRTGVSTAAIKKLKPVPDKDGGLLGYEVELRDTSGQEFDRLLDRTDGKPVQRIVEDVKLPVRVEFTTPLTRLREKREAERVQQEQGGGGDDGGHAAPRVAGR